MYSAASTGSNFCARCGMMYWMNAYDFFENSAAVHPSGSWWDCCS